MTDGCEQQLEIQSARSWAAPVRATGTVQKRQALRPVHHIQSHTCRVTLLQPARRAAVLGQPSSLRPLCFIRAESPRSLSPFFPKSLLTRARIFKRLWSPGIDSNESVPADYVARQASTNTINLFRLGS